MPGLLACACELLEKNLITATVLVLGISFIIFFIPKIMNSNLSDPFQGVAIQKLSPWRQTLMGETISLPSAKEARYAPKDFLSHVLQIARINSAGIITEVPKENEELSEFLKRGDAK